MSVPGPDSTVLERNLRALSITSPVQAALIRRTGARADIRFTTAPDGAVSGVLTELGGERQLASLRRPVEEARRLAETVPLESTAGVVVLGFGVGHHVAQLAARLKRTGVIVAFEPDVGLLRAVFERVDCVPWMTSTNFVLLTDPDDAAAISSSLRGVEALLAVGTRFLEHPPSRARLGTSATLFGSRFAEIVRSVRTTVLTTLVQVDVTLKNFLGNAAAYGCVPGVAELANIAKGRPAVVVSAGPSLHRNIEELAKPGVRDRVVIVAVQTVLKTLLDHGVRPHFVTSLDYSEVSARFFEGLTARDVEGITLIVEPKAHPAVMKAWPGAVRCPAERVLDDILGPGLSRPMGELKAGATVAHLAYYFARHLGCDPVILAGQDLGFTDGQYYHAGAAIHGVWSAELSEFNTLEMLEWQRIVRSRSMLHRANDFLGRPVYTDEQMTTYLAQFERDFLADANAGLSVIDATEGGVRKRHTRVMTLHEAIAAAPDAPGIGDLGELRSNAAGASDTARRIVDRLREVRRDVWQVGSLSRTTAELLGRVRANIADQALVNRLIGQIYDVRDQVQRLGAGYALTQYINQTGAFNRFRADRSIELDDTLSPLDRQVRQVERDLTNVTWLADAADEVGRLIDDAVRRHEGDEPAPHRRAVRSQDARGGQPAPARKRVLSIVLADPDVNGLGVWRDLAEPVANGRTALSITLERLAACSGLDGVIVVSPDAARARSIAGALPSGLDVRFVPVDESVLRARQRSVGAARLYSRRAWRGGIGALTVYDEALHPALAAKALSEHAGDAAVIVNADWCLLDPAIVAEQIARYRENTALNRITFSQAPPGLSACVVDRSILAEWAARADAAGPFATVGGLLGYIPIAPQADPIAKPQCIKVTPAVRDLTERCIPDSASRRALLAPLLERSVHGRGPSAGEVAEYLRRHGGATREPEIVHFELTTARRAFAQRAAWLGSTDGAGARHSDPARIHAMIDRLGERAMETAVSFDGRGDPLLHPNWREIITHASEARLGAVHVRTDLLGDESELVGLLEAGPSVISVDVLADSPEGYRAVTGIDGFEIVTRNLKRLIELRGEGVLPLPWIVARLTRCDAVYGDLEGFYDRWLMACGCAVIDPLPRAIEGQRIAPLPVPASVAARDARTKLRIAADGTMTAPAGAPWDIADLRQGARA